MTPLTDAVGFIDDDEVDGRIGQQPTQVGGSQLFRCREHEFNRAPADPGAGAPNLIGGNRRC
jgi:hypothetical protein